MNHLPINIEYDVKLMEYGDLSSLVVEYPDYNSMGSVLAKVGTVKQTGMSAEAVKIEYRLKLPKTVSSFNDLAGRAIIVTTKDGDLVAYGVLINELSSAGQLQRVKGVAVCENLASTVRYKAYFTLSQA